MLEPKAMIELETGLIVEEDTGLGMHILGMMVAYHDELGNEESEDFFNFEGPPNQPLELWPNPAYDHIELKLLKPLESDAKILVYNLKGDVVLEKRIKPDDHYLIELEGLVPGPYELSVVSQEEVVEQARFVKSR